MWTIPPSAIYWDTRRKLLMHRNKIKFGGYGLLLGCVFYAHSDLFNSPQCAIEMPPRASQIFRQPEHCAFCENTTKVARTSKISPRDFRERYVATAAPVVVTDGAKGWPAFSFELLRSLHRNQTLGAACHFFPYESGFKDLEDVFSMGSARAGLVPGERPWYVGWGDCGGGKGLRRFYSEPYFLGTLSESIATTWVFMGGPGNGAHMHIDNVHYPSWQAQLKGKKLWKFAPPPECYNICHSMRVLVEPGEIIVADTNRWYHQTVIVEGDLSITIGSEFD